MTAFSINAPNIHSTARICIKMLLFCILFLHIVFTWINMYKYFAHKYYT